MSAPTRSRLSDRLVLPADLPRAEWLAHRSEAIGGSDVSAILGHNRWRSAWQVWAEKTAFAQPKDEVPSEAAWWGIRLEPIVAERLAELQGMTIARPAGTYQHPVHSFMRCTPDGLVPDLDAPSALVEIKTTTAWLAQEWDADSGKVPDAALLQTFHSLEVLGLDEAWIAVLVGGQRLVPVHVERDQDLIDHLVALEADWWRRHVIGREPPPLAGSDAETDFIDHLRTAVPGATKWLDPAEVVPWLQARSEAKRLIKDTEQAVDKIDNAIKLLLGEATEGTVDGGDTVVTWRPQDKSAPDAKAADLAVARALDAVRLLTSAGAGSAAEHDEILADLTAALAEARHALARRCEPFRVLRPTKAAEALLTEGGSW